MSAGGFPGIKTTPIWLTIGLAAMAGAASAQTNGNDTLIFTGTLGSFAAQTLVTPSGETILVPAGTWRDANSTFDGLGGTDFLIASNDADRLIDPSGTIARNIEIYIFGDGNDVALLNSPIPLILSGGRGDNILLSAGPGTADTIAGADGNDILDGGPGDDSLQGEAGDDMLIGGEGNDTLQGGPGNDLLIDGAGDDFLDLVGDATDPAQHDTLRIGTGTDLLRLTGTGLGLDPVSILSQSFAGSVLTTGASLSFTDDLGSYLLRLTIIEDTGLPTGLLDGIVLVDGGSETVLSRTGLLGEIPAAAIPLTASGLLLAGGLALLFRHRRGGPAGPVRAARAQTPSATLTASA